MGDKCDSILIFKFCQNMTYGDSQSKDGRSGLMSLFHEGPGAMLCAPGQF